MLLYFVYAAMMTYMRLMKAANALMSLFFSSVRMAWSLSDSGVESVVCSL